MVPLCSDGLSVSLQSTMCFLCIHLPFVSATLWPQHMQKFEFPVGSEVRFITFIKVAFHCEFTGQRAYRASFTFIFFHQCA